MCGSIHFVIWRTFEIADIKRVLLSTHTHTIYVYKIHKILLITFIYIINTNFLCLFVSIQNKPLSTAT